VRAFVLLWGAMLGITVLSSAQDAPRLVIDSRGHGGMVNGIVFTPDGQRLVTSCEDKVIRVWNPVSGEIEESYRHRQGDNFEGALARVSMSPDGRYLVLSTGTYEQRPDMYDVRIIDRTVGKIVALLRGHQAAALTTAFSPDGSLLFTGDMAGQIRVWQTASFTGASADPPRVVTDSVYLVGHTTPITMISTTADGSLFVSTDSAGQGFVWQRQPNGFYQGLGDIGAGSGNVLMAQYSEDGSYLVAAGKDELTYLLDGMGNLIRILDEDEPGQKTCMAISPDGTRVAIGTLRPRDGSDTTVDVYDLPGGQRSVRFLEQPSGTSAVGWYPDGSAIAAAGGDNHDITIFDAAPGGGDVIATIEGDGAGVWSVAIAPNPEAGGVRVAFGNINDYRDSSHDVGLDNRLHRIFDFAAMRLTEDATEGELAEFRRAVFAQNGASLALADDFSLSVSGVIRPFSQVDVGGNIRSFSFTPEGNIMVGTQYTLNLYRPNGQQLINFSEQAGATYAMAPTTDGNYLATASVDQAVHLWNLKTGRRLASLFVSRDGEWVCWTSSGHYAASPGGERYIGWHVNKPADQLSEFFPSSVFRERFHRPGIVTAAVGRGNVSEAVASVASSQAISDSAEASTAVAAMLPPSVEWFLPAQTRGETGGDGEITVKSRIESPGSSLNEVKLLLNGKAVENFANVGGENFDLEHDVALVPGENRLAVFARNEESGALSEERVVTFRVATPDPAPGGGDAVAPAAALASAAAAEVVESLPPEMMPNLYLLSVGISEYQNAELTLGFCDDDALAIAEVFGEQRGRLFNRTEIKTLIDQDASRDGILLGLEWLQANATQKDVIILFLAAHGMNEGRNYYLVPWDGDFGSLRRTGVSWDDFADVLGNLPAKTLMFLDTCHSGQLGENLYTFAGRTRGGANQINDATEAIRELTSEENGVVVMAASTQGEQSVEHPDWGHGAFTLSLIEGLRGEADFIEDGIIQLRELDTYVAERVKELSQGIQHPTTVKPSSISRFPLIRVR